MKKILLAVGIALLVISAASAQAEVLFQQPPVYEIYGGYFSDVPFTQIADNFSISSGGTITEVKWTGGYYDIFTDDFTIRFYSDAAGVPGTLLTSYAVGSDSGRTNDTGHFFTVDDLEGHQVYNYDYTLSTSFNAVAGDTYWISILNGSTDNWIWADSGPRNTYVIAYRLGDSGSWTADNIGNRVFELDGASPGGSSVPEPTAMILYGLGFAGVGLYRRMRRKV